MMQMFRAQVHERRYVPPAGPAAPAIAIATTVIGTGLSIAQQSQQAAAQAGMANYQAQLARNNQMVAEWHAQRALQQGQVDEQQQRQDGEPHRRAARHPREPGRRYQQRQPHRHRRGQRTRGRVRRADDSQQRCAQGLQFPPAGLRGRGQCQALRCERGRCDGLPALRHRFNPSRQCQKRRGQMEGLVLTDVYYCERGEGVADMQPEMCARADSCESFLFCLQRKSGIFRRLAGDGRHRSAVGGAMASGPFTLSQLARAVGMSVEDAQFYLARGLLPPARRRRGRSGDLAYHREHVVRLRFLGRARGCGFSVDDVERFVDPKVLLTCADVLRLAERRLEEVRRLSGVESPVAVSLEQLIALCDGIGGKQDCRILAFLADEKDPPKLADQG